MIQPLLDRLQQMPMTAPSFRRADAAHVLARHGVDPWFLYAYEMWRSRWHVWRGILWATMNLDRKGGVLETGCGCGWNLFWLAANGFGHLGGIDVDTAAVAAGNELSRHSGYRVVLRADNALEPASLGDASFSLILALNWTYHVPAFRLDSFLQRYHNHLLPGGVLLIDAIDDTFSANPDSRYLTSDWDKLVMERRPSEYIHRFTLHEVSEIAGSSGYRVVKIFGRRGEIPRTLFILRRG